MKINTILLFIILTSSLTLAAYESYTYWMPNQYTFEHMNLTAYQVINLKANTVDGNVVVCVGDTHDLIGDFVEYETIFSNMKIYSLCTNTTDQNNCNTGKYNIVDTWGINGPLKTISVTENDLLHQNEPGFTNTQPYTTAVYSQDEMTVINKVLTAYGGARLSTFGVPEKNREITYAKSEGGFGCDGDYIISVAGPVTGTKYGYGQLYKFRSDSPFIKGDDYDFTFSKEGTYTVTYTTTINRCAGLMKEIMIGSPPDLHPFVQRKSGEMPWSIQKTVTVKAISNPNIKIEEEGTPAIVKVCENNICRFDLDCLHEGVEGDTLELSLDFTNKGDTAVTIYNVKVVKDESNKPVSITSYSADPATVKLEPGESKTVWLTIKGTAPTDAKDVDHKLVIMYEYAADTSSIRDSITGKLCGTTQGSGAKMFIVPFSVCTNPVNEEGLAVSVNIAPAEINAGNYGEVNKMGINITGRVLKTPNNFVASGATVTLESLTKELNGKSTQCQKTLTNYTNSNGEYAFYNVQLPESCKPSINDVGKLNARVCASLEDLNDCGSDSSDINIIVPPLTCTLTPNLKEITQSDETYTFKVDIKNGGTHDIKSYKYDCGDGKGERTTTEKEFTCTYAVEDTPDVTRSATFVIDYETGGQPNPNSPAKCYATVGLCQVYI